MPIDRKALNSGNKASNNEDINLRQHFLDKRAGNSSSSHRWIPAFCCTIKEKEQSLLNCLAILIQDNLQNSDILTCISEKLSEREHHVLREFLCLNDVKTTAHKLGTKQQTIRNQLVSIRSKLKIHSHTELASKVLIALFHLYEQSKITSR